MSLNCYYAQILSSGVISSRSSLPKTEISIFSRLFKVDDAIIANYFIVNIKNKQILLKFYIKEFSLQ